MPIRVQLRPGGVVMIDNVFWRGRVSDPTVKRFFLVLLFLLLSL